MSLVTYAGHFRDLYTGFGHPNSGVPKNTFQVFFSLLYFNKKCTEVVINDFPKDLIILNTKMQSEEETMIQKDQNKRRNLRQPERQGMHF